MSDVNDRGTKKWTAMMLPEHEQMLKEMWAEKEYREKPILDEQKLMEINTQLQLAIHNNLTIELKHYDGRDYLTKKGKLLKIDSVSKCLRFNNEDRTEIKLNNVLDVYID